MVDTFCTSMAVIRKAGLNVSASGAYSSALISEYINQAEGQIVAKAKMNLITNYSLLTVSGAKYVLQDCASSLAAIPLINYNMGTYNSQAEAQTMLDVNNNIANDLLKLFEDKDYTAYIFAGA